MQPHDPFFIQILPENLKFDEKIILKGIKWHFPWDPRDYRATDEYDLVITRAIQISSRSERGLFYGLQTVIEILRFYQSKIPFQSIHDYPALSLRAIHLDLKAQMPTLAYLEDQIRDLTHYKINSVVVEWEDKFPFAGELACIRHPSAFSVPEKDRFLETCWDHYLDVIPLIQSLGHFSYVLKHPEFAALLEFKPDKSREVMFCPSKAKTRVVIQKIHDQIMAGMGKHQECEFIHIGMDETYDLGSCAECKSKIQSLGDAGKSKLFMDHLSWITQYYLEKGKRPIMWHDMLVRYPQYLSQLDKRIILCDWEYEMPLPKVFPSEMNIDATGDTIDWVPTWAPMTLEQMKVKKPATFDYFYEHYWKAPHGKYPFKLFPYTGFFQEKGYTVITAPAVQSGRLTPICPRFYQSTPNILFFDRHAIRTGASGSICTSWAVRRSAWPLLQFGFVLHALTCWNPTFIVDNVSLMIYWKNYFGLNEMETKDYDIPFIAEFFNNLGKVGGDPERLYQILMNNRDDPSQNISIDQIKSILTQKIPLYLQILTKLEPKVQFHKKHFQYLILMTEFLSLLWKIFTICIGIETIAIAIDEGRSDPLLPQDQMNSMLTQLQDYNLTVSSIQVKMKALDHAVLLPSESEIHQKDLFGFVSEMSVQYAQWFSKFNDAKTDFVENIIQSSMKRGNF